MPIRALRVGGICVQRLSAGRATAPDAAEPEQQKRSSGVSQDAVCYAYHGGDTRAAPPGCRESEAMRFEANEKYTQALLDTLVHIQTHLDDDLSLDQLAGRAGFSAYHFHRVFSEFVGEPVKEYIRRLRLERSTFRLRISDATILNIALDCGFKTHETYTRAFKRRFGVSPSVFRENHLREMKRRVREVHYADAQVRLGEIDRLAGASKELNVRVESVRPIKTAFVRHLGPYESVLEPGSSLASLWEELFAWGNARGLIGPESLLIGVGHDDPSITPPDKLRFDVCVEVPEFADSTGNVAFQTLQPGLYAAARHYGSFDNLPDAYLHIGMQWLPRSKYRIAMRPVFEVYGHTRVNDDLQIHHTDIYLPIEPKTNENGRS
jgi:AraC family transcriptional regulator